MTDSVDTSNNKLSIQPIRQRASRLDNLHFQPLSAHYPKVNAFSSFIGWATIFIVLLLVSLLFDNFNPHFVVLLAVALFSLLSGLFGYYSAKACGYHKGDFDLLFRSGLWWKKQTALSFSRIQHIDISHGPLERKYNIATIKFFTAGGHASDLKIPGLPKKIAESLRTEILQYAKFEFESNTNVKLNTKPSSTPTSELKNDNNLINSATTHE